MSIRLSTYCKRKFARLHINLKYIVIALPMLTNIVKGDTCNDETKEQKDLGSYKT